MKLYYGPVACSPASHIVLLGSGEANEKTKVDLGRHQTWDGKDFSGSSPRGYFPALKRTTWAC